ncbi:MAG: hypothetical protein PGN34_12160 [Methylobacterium frigidaeris]
MRRTTIVAALLLAGGCSPSCDETVIARSDAPDGRRGAVVLRRDCGATTGSSTRVAILSPGDLPSDAGTVFSADDDHGAAAPGDGGGPWAEARWLTADHLLVSHAARSRVFRQSGEAAGVRISYRAVDR